MLHFSTFLNGSKNKSHRLQVISTNDMIHQLGTKRIPTHFTLQFSKIATRMLSGSRHVTKLPFLWIKLKIRLECRSSQNARAYANLFLQILSTFWYMHKRPRTKRSTTIPNNQIKPHGYRSYSLKYQSNLLAIIKVFKSIAVLTNLCHIPRYKRSSQSSASSCITLILKIITRSPIVTMMSNENPNHPSTIAAVPTPLDTLPFARSCAMIDAATDAVCCHNTETSTKMEAMKMIASAI